MVARRLHLPSPPAPAGREGGPAVSRPRDREDRPPAAVCTPRPLHVEPGDQAQPAECPPGIAPGWWGRAVPRRRSGRSSGATGPPAPGPPSPAWPDAPADALAPRTLGVVLRPRVASPPGACRPDGGFQPAQGLLTGGPQAPPRAVPLPPDAVSTTSLQRAEGRSRLAIARFRPAVARFRLVVARFRSAVHRRLCRQFTLGWRISQCRNEVNKYFKPLPPVGRRDRRYCG